MHLFCLHARIGQSHFFELKQISFSFEFVSYAN
jgi:hypothetical protein